LVHVKTAVEAKPQVDAVVPRGTGNNGPNYSGGRGFGGGFASYGGHGGFGGGFGGGSSFGGGFGGGFGRGGRGERGGRGGRGFFVNSANMGRGRMHVGQHLMNFGEHAIAPFGVGDNPESALQGQMFGWFSRQCFRNGKNPRGNCPACLA
jgi:hypothetical protein